MKILVAADGQGAEIYADALAGGFAALGHTVHRFAWRGFFYDYPYKPMGQGWWERLRWVWYRAQNKFMVGPALWALNRALLRQCRAEQPDLLFVYRGTHVWPGTLRAIKTLGVVVFGYNNDDPFGEQYARYMWRHFVGALPHYDHVFAYRAKNLDDYVRVGVSAEKTSLLRSYYVAARNYPTPLDETLRADVTFVGHFEPDGRDAALLALLRAGVRVRLCGTLWEQSPLYAELLAALGVDTIRPLYGAEYNLALNAARIGLVFLSKLNHDTYTRRCFEIPATGACMVSEYTDDLARNLFTPDEEAVYFKNTEELVDKVQHLLANPEVCARIGAAGRARLLADGHEVTDRARQVLAQFDKIVGLH
jgi:spore maturation protein CgeB